MLTGSPLAWLLLLALPFVSSALIGGSALLRTLCARHNRFTLTIGIAGLGCLIAGLVGLLSPVYGLPVTVLGGIASGFAVFRRPRNDDTDGDDWRWRRPPPDEPPRPPTGDGSTDWALFDRLRAQWERPELPVR